MPAKSKSQRRLMGMAYAYRKGMKKLSDFPEDIQDEIKRIADNMKLKDLKKFAKSKENKLPKKIKNENLFKEDVKPEKITDINNAIYNIVKYEYIHSQVKNIKRIHPKRKENTLQLIERRLEPSFKYFFDSFIITFKDWINYHSLRDPIKYGQNQLDLDEDVYGVDLESGSYINEIFNKIVGMDDYEIYSKSLFRMWDDLYEGKYSEEFQSAIEILGEFFMKIEIENNKFQLDDMEDNPEEYNEDEIEKLKKYIEQLENEPFDYDKYGYLLKNFYDEFGEDSFYSLINENISISDLYDLYSLMYSHIYFELWFEHWDNFVKKNTDGDYGFMQIYDRNVILLNQMGNWKSLDFSGKVFLADRVINSVHATGKMLDHMDTFVGDVVDYDLLEELFKDNTYADEWDEEIVGNIV